MIAGKLAELAAKRAMSGFIKSRLGSFRAHKKFTQWGYLMPRSKFDKLYRQARDVERQSARLLALKPKARIPKILTTPGDIRAGTKYLYVTEFDIYDKDGVFHKTSYTGIPTDFLHTREAVEERASKMEIDYWDEKEGWTVENPRLVKVLRQG